MSDKQTSLAASITGSAPAAQAAANAAAGGTEIGSVTPKPSLPSKSVGISVTDKAVKEIRRLMEADPTTKGSYLRVQVIGGGCSGMSYKLGFDAAAKAVNDKSFTKEDVEIVIDSKSYLYLSGTELDFTDGLNGTGFVFNNPNAKRTCGCGSSFSA
ncbi:MAG: iron-sulfur cluster assembly accessory protein [Bdellovibrionales bacterium]|nr:iron-sulfur cluster assembly accessory protein [Bdellovibrionales bacterium]